MNLNFVSIQIFKMMKALANMTLFLLDSSLMDWHIRCARSLSQWRHHDGQVCEVQVQLLCALQDRSSPILFVRLISCN